MGACGLAENTIANGRALRGRLLYLAGDPATFRRRYAAFGTGSGVDARVIGDFIKIRGDIGRFWVSVIEKDSIIFFSHVGARRVVHLAVHKKEQSFGRSRSIDPTIIGCESVVGEGKADRGEEISKRHIVRMPMQYVADVVVYMNRFVVRMPGDRLVRVVAQVNALALDCDEEIRVYMYRMIICGGCEERSCKRMHEKCCGDSECRCSCNLQI